MIALKCPICGKPLPPSKTKPRKFCSQKCGRLAWRIKNLSPYQKMKARLAERDAEYAASPCAAPITVEERDCIRVETRGRVPCGSFCPRFVGRN